MPNIAVQLYTVREVMERDFIGTLRKVAEVGYEAVEFYTYGGLSPLALRKVVDDLGIKPLSSHISLTRLEEELEVVIQEAQAIGLDYLVCPWLPTERRQTVQDYADLAATLEKIGDRCNTEGIRFAYHNHDFELAKQDGQVGLDRLLNPSQKSGVQAELDLYWIHYAGEDPTHYIERYANRCDLLHVKDASKTDGSFAEVGSGVLDWQAIFAAAEASGAKWYIVEQDVCKGDPIESIRDSLEFLRRSPD
ncbi:sugar phosphate isomerase/epimerase family protein [Alicyclobacillus dauci]|uniref:Sugar phosphate isomerase/epimerase n=1 Tax=Alicyclobacillus dauci TaxID=1475485 RepID=A0ABY6Z6H6_9BACL|nr:sugar phosphate isomerase/epimerase [Alicyclobacillus dauci]WAH38350.1 sugar phosphate isomerase/epimerase [Alicyclobacillus dauci]